jgi:hypothetical protein
VSELPGDRDYQPFAVGLNYGSLETDLPAWVSIENETSVVPQRIWKLPHLSISSHPNPAAAACRSNLVDVEL